MNEADPFIIPPPDIRNIADKTAEFVGAKFDDPNARRQFEDRLREEKLKAGNSKFSFLNHNDPYRPYYDKRIDDIRSGKVEAKKDERPKAADQEPSKPTKPVPIEPPPFEFTADIPAKPAFDIDIIKLTAQFAARNGPEFMSSLSSRERNNPQFDFLRPSHSLFPYFTKLIDQYRKIMRPTKTLEMRLKSNAESRFEVLDRVVQRVEYARYVEEQKKIKEEEADAERIAYASIDWHDFVVVQTIEFVEADEVMELPPPTSIKEIEGMSIAQKSAMKLLQKPSSGSNLGDKDVEMEVTTPQVRPPIPLPQKPVVPPMPVIPQVNIPAPRPMMPMMPPPMNAIRPPMPQSPATGRSSDDVEMEDDERAKRVKMEEDLVPESEWIRMNPSPITVKIQNQTMTPPTTFEIGPIEQTTLVSEVKDLVAKNCGIPVAKQKLVASGNSKTLVNTNAIAFYNLKMDDLILLSLKERGGRR
ncbi:hypothetical protein HK098_007618 [Nowakowskiella sp. JEL0407]|nr:hypothetical protein HK098_007618 [Nowakowskiella sp. JEL0407]